MFSAITDSWHYKSVFESATREVQKINRELPRPIACCGSGLVALKFFLAAFDSQNLARDFSAVPNSDSSDLGTEQQL
jgi:hypothetical protein